jgi:aminoglycoside/choline kinase family phosphotransferase
MPQARSPEELDSDRPGKDSLDPRIVLYLDRRAHEGLRAGSVEPLAGDASTRRYYRVSWLEGSVGSEGTSSVLALMPEAFDPEREPFLNVARLFTEMPVRVPRVQDVSGPEGILLLEDCGDELLQTFAEHADRETRSEFYVQALRILARIQSRGADLESESYLPYGVAFDEEKLSWELDYFRRHFLGGFRGALLSASDEESLRDSFSLIAGEIAALPRVLCHRDYHSRNLMVVGDELVVLDFQDARMGPVSYDLVSLLRDSYVGLEADFAEEMSARFCSIASRVSPERLRDELEIVALQRNLKALGTFGYQCTVRRKSVYEQYVPRTLEHVRSNLSRNPRWDGLRRILAAHLPELR